jgi:hypothetical protein
VTILIQTPSRIKVIAIKKTDLAWIKFCYRRIREKTRSVPLFFLHNFGKYLRFFQIEPIKTVEFKIMQIGKKKEET